MTSTLRTKPRPIKQLVSKNQRSDKHFSFVFLYTIYLTVPKHCVCCNDLSRPDLSWRTCLYINYLGKIYEENEWRKHFRTAHCDVTAQL